MLPMHMNPSSSFPVPQQLFEEQVDGCSDSERAIERNRFQYSLTFSLALLASFNFHQTDKRYSTSSALEIWCIHNNNMLRSLLLQASKSSCLLPVSLWSLTDTEGVIDILWREVEMAWIEHPLIFYFDYPYAIVCISVYQSSRHGHMSSSLFPHRIATYLSPHLPNSLLNLRCHVWQG